MASYYIFALFVAVLICVIAFVCKLLFANVKRQRKLLDEQETKLLQLYTSVETLMEEFNEQVKLTTTEFKEHEYRFTSGMSVFDLPPELEQKVQIQQEGAGFKKALDDVVNSPVAESAMNIAVNSSVQMRTDAILSLAKEGKSDNEIAQELGITRNEVLLVIGLRG
ncbi:MAG: hypothetical protein FWD05_04225 [Oscillospiraceae bacterium]|nr:hypothetical protein [Oscillospiraceae bacterium]